MSTDRAARPTFTASEIDAALARVEIAKQNHPQGFEFLTEFALPSRAISGYSLRNAEAHAARMAREPRALIYSVGWLQGLAVGIALGQSTR